MADRKEKQSGYGETFGMILTSGKYLFGHDIFALIFTFLFVISIGMLIAQYLSNQKLARLQAKLDSLRRQRAALEEVRRAAALGAVFGVA